MPRWPAWCWRKRRVRTKEEPAETAEDREQAKQEAELRVAPRLLRPAAGALRGRLVSGAALYCQKALCRQIRAGGGDYLFGIKANQPDLLEDVRLLFTDPLPGERLVTAHTVTKCRGRLEERCLRASATLAGYLGVAGWPEVGLVLEVTATVRWPRRPDQVARHEVRHFVSSLPATPPPAHALQFVRQHWHIENRLHWTRDMALGEDACQVRAGRAQRGRGAAACPPRPHPGAALRLLGLTPS